MITADEARKITELSKTDTKQWDLLDKIRFHFILKSIKSNSRMGKTYLETRPFAENIWSKLESMGYKVRSSPKTLTSLFSWYEISWEKEE